MQIGSIRYPDNDRYIRIHQSLVDACKGNACAAALVRFFEGWHDHHLRQAEYDKSHDKLARVVALDGWQYHSNEQLETGVIIYRITAINDAIKTLVELGFLRTDVPQQLQMLYRTGRTRWFRLEVKAINACLATGAAPKPRTLQFPKPSVLPFAAEINDAQKVIEYRDRRRKEFNKAKGKIVAKTAVDAKRLKMIADRLEFFTPDKLCLAVEGNLASAFHQGQNDTGAIYDSLETIFKDNAKVEMFIQRALDAGIHPNDVSLKLSGAPDSQAPVISYPSLATVALPYMLTPETSQLSTCVRQVVAMCARKRFAIDPETFLEHMRPVIERVNGMITTSNRSYARHFVEVLNEAIEKAAA